LFDPWIEPKETSKIKKILKNTTMCTTKVSEGTSAIVQLGPSSTTPPRKVPNVSLESVEGKVFSILPIGLISTPNVTITVEQSDAPNKDNLLNKGGALSLTREEVAKKKVARANTRFDNLIDNNALNSLIYVVSNYDLPMMLSPKLSPRIEVHPPHHM